MDEAEVERLAELLREIRDGQREQIAIQREHYEIAKTQYDKANAINDRAERIQARSAALIDYSGKLFKVITPVLVILVLAAGWMLFTLRL